jgi:hypothetical protein
MSTNTRSKYSEPIHETAIATRRDQVELPAVAVGFLEFRQWFPRLVAVFQFPS